MLSRLVISAVTAGLALPVSGCFFISGQSPSARCAGETEEEPNDTRESANALSGEAARFWVPVLETYPYHPKASWCLGFSRLLAADGTEIWQRSDLVPAIGWWARAHLHHDPRHDAAFERDPRGLTTPMAQALQRLEEREAAACMRSLDYRATRADLQTCFRLTHQADVRAGLEAELSRE